MNSRFIDNYEVNLIELSRLHKYLKQQTQLHVAKKSKTSSAKDIDTILVILHEKKNDQKAILKGVAVALLYYGLLRATEVPMVEMEDIKIETIGVYKIIEVMFKHECKQRNEGFVYYAPTKCFPMFSRYMNEICQDTVAAGNVQFWKIGTRWVKGRYKTPARLTSTFYTKSLVKSWTRAPRVTPAIAGEDLQLWTLPTQECPSSTWSNADIGNLTGW